MSDKSTVADVSVVGDEIKVSSEPGVATNILRRLGSGILLLSKATVYYRFLMGRQLMVIQNNHLWREMERRDYRTDPNGVPLWQNKDEQFYSSWYQFLEHGFRYVTGLQRETAYSAIKLARSATFTALASEELKRFTRLANALRIVAAERKQLEITPELLRQAQEVSIGQFRQITSAAPTANHRGDASSMDKIIRFLRAAATRNPNVVNEFWTTVERVMAATHQDHADALESIVSACSALGSNVTRDEGYHTHEGGAR